MAKKLILNVKNLKKTFQNQCGQHTRPLLIRQADRITYDGTWENNLFNFFMKVMPKLTSDLKKPFALKNQQRIDDTIIHKAIREAFVNLIIHADYQLEAGTLKIIKREDEFIFSNPGSLKLSVEEIFKGGNSKSRNPHMQTMLRMIGFGDNAGSGIPAILDAWRGVDWIQPILCEDTKLNQVTLTLKTLANWTDSANTIRNYIVHNIKLSDEQFNELNSSLLTKNLGLPLETKVDFEELSKAMVNALKPYIRSEYSEINKALIELINTSEVLLPTQDNIAKIAQYISSYMEKEVLMANKSANKLANKSANKSANKLVNNAVELTQRQKEILDIIVEGEEYTTEEIAQKIGLKSSRTRELLKELVDLNILESIGKTNTRKYIKISK